MPSEEVLVQNSARAMATSELVDSFTRASSRRRPATGSRTNRAKS